MNVAELIISALAEHGVRQVWGVVGDALNPLTDAIRRDERIEWIGVRHEEAAAFAVSAQAQLGDTIGVCMGTVGPGSIHLLNGLYDAKKSHAPVLAICGQVPSGEIGTDFFQEVDNDTLFADVSVFCQTLSTPQQLPHLLEQAVNAAYAQRGVAVLTLPGDVGELDVSRGTALPRFAPPAVATTAPDDQIGAAVAALTGADVTLLVGHGALHARTEVLALADRLAAPMVLTLKAKEGLEQDNPYQVGQSGLIGNPAAAKAMDSCDVLFMIGTDFPYRDWYPDGKTVLQLDVRGENIGRRTPVDHALVGDAAATVSALLPRLTRRDDRSHLDTCTEAFRDWHERERSLLDPDHDRTLVGKVRAVFDNPDERIRPEALAAAIDRAAPDSTIFTADTGMSTAWLARFVELRGSRRLIGSFNLGSMANALPMALGAQALDRGRPVVSFSGDGGLMMLLGDLRTAVTYRLPVRVVVFDNGRLGMVKLEQEQGGLPEFGTELDNPDIAAVAAAMGLQSRRVTEPDRLAEAVEWAFGVDGPVLLDVVTNPDEIAVPPKPTLAQGWGFAIAKSRETLQSRRG